MSIYTSVAFGIEYLYRSAMEYLNKTYHSYPTSLRPVDLPAATWREIQDGESAARIAAESYSGECDGRTVI